LVSPERKRNKNRSREATASAKQMVFMSYGGRKPSDRRGKSAISKLSIWFHPSVNFFGGLV
jgi:hypothetical protein